ncbi:leucine-rich repeat protein [Histomonas meleagridis]|uniref:leucine-rich repeat protein n=1 Tax=Histomonas meleagridis TaxID=135588 RepID=UPI0035596261|nr:leucine-rich repeat protein [Histomonas meleagridis]KAH0803063.1 leucine-rich repeat protein [Histomonas meleagridis]
MIFSLFAFSVQYYHTSKIYNRGIIDDSSISEDDQASIELLTIGRGNYEIANEAFSNWAKLTEVTIEDSIGIIHDNAFKGCNNLKAVSLGNNISYIGSGAFSACPNLVCVHFFGESEPTIGQNAFSGASSSLLITVPTYYDGQNFGGFSTIKGFQICNIIDQPSNPSTIPYIVGIVILGVLVFVLFCWCFVKYHQVNLLTQELEKKTSHHSKHSQQHQQAMPAPSPMPAPMPVQDQLPGPEMQKMSFAQPYNTNNDDFDNPYMQP